MTPVAVSNASVHFAGQVVLDSVTVAIEAGTHTAIVGPNGAGKTTLLRVMLGLQPLTAGSVQLLGGEPSRTRQQVGYVPQRAAVSWDFPATALDVVLMGVYSAVPWWRPLGSAERQRAVAALEQVGLAAAQHKQIRVLSGGQQQRVMLARALVAQPQLYVLDEPFTGIDAASERAIASVLRAQHEAGATIVQVHHNLQTVPEYFSHVVLLRHRVQASGPVTTVFTPEHIERTYGVQV